MNDLGDLDLDLRRRLALGEVPSFAPRGLIVLSGLGQAPDVVVWDPQLLVQPDHPVLFQRGCPEGYFSEFVAPGSSGAQPYPRSMLTGNPADTELSQSMWVRCRLSATTTPDTLIAETGLSPSEAIQVYTGAVADTIAQIPQNILKTLGTGIEIGKWLVVGLVAVAAIQIFGGRK